MCSGPAGALSVLLPIPAFLEPFVHFNPDSQEFGIDAEGRCCLAVDACIAPALLALWAQGIPTISACCLHGAGEGVITLPRIHAPDQPPPRANWVLLEEANATIAAQAFVIDQYREAAETIDAAYALMQSVYRDETVPGMIRDVKEAQAFLAQPQPAAVEQAAAVLDRAEMVVARAQGVLSVLNDMNDDELKLTDALWSAEYLLEGSIDAYRRARLALRGAGGES